MTEQTARGVGLVLSGGGAKGAYQVGVLKALTEMGVQVDAIAGASIGALNGAVAAAAPTQALAVEHLQTLWGELANTSPIKISPRAYRRLAEVPGYLLMLNGFGLTARLSGMAGSQLLANLAASHAPGHRQLMRNLLPLRTFLEQPQGMACDRRLRALIDEYLPETGMPERVAMYISVYATQGAGLDIARVMAAGLGFGDTPPSEFYQVQRLPVAVQKQALLASAALPLLFAPQQIDGRDYSDGGLGGWNTMQGNTPIQPLLDAGYRHIVVTHLSDGSMWDRLCFPGASIIEIRPGDGGISRAGGARDLLGFNNASIPAWIAQGYEDTLRCVGRVKATLDVHSALAESERSRDAALAQTGEDELRAALQRLLPN